MATLVIPAMYPTSKLTLKLKGLTPADEIIFTQSSMFDTKKFKQYHPDAYLQKEVRNKFGQSVLAVYKIQ